MGFRGKRGITLFPIKKERKKGFRGEKGGGLQASNRRKFASMTPERGKFHMCDGKGGAVIYGNKGKKRDGKRSNGR